PPRCGPRRPRWGRFSRVSYSLIPRPRLRSRCSPRRSSLPPCSARSATRSGTCLASQLLPQKLVDDLRISLALRLAHHRADEEAEHALLAAAVRLDLLWIRREDRVDHRHKLSLIRDCCLR